MKVQFLEAFPKLPSTLGKKAGYRQPDAIESPWEALERTLQLHGYFQGGYRKREAARSISAHMDPARNRSRSFQVIRDGILDLVR